MLQALSQGHCNYWLVNSPINSISWLLLCPSHIAVPDDTADWAEVAAPYHTSYATQEAAKPLLA